MANVKKNNKNAEAQNTQEATTTAQEPQNKQEVTTVAQEADNKNVVVIDPKVQLDNYIAILRGCADNIRSNYVTIGTYLLKIKDEKLIVTTEGWQKFVAETLDMSVPTAYRIMSTVEKFYNPKALETNQEVIAKLDGFKDSTISRLLPLGDYETIKGAILDGTFTAEMTAREVTAKVADIIGRNKKKAKVTKVDSSESGGESNSPESDGESEGESEGDNNEFEKRENPNTLEPANYDSEVYAFITSMLEATSLIEVQNRAKAFRDRWFK